MHGSLLRRCGVIPGRSNPRSSVVAAGSRAITWRSYIEVQELHLVRFILARSLWRPSCPWSLERASPTSSDCPRRNACPPKNSPRRGRANRCRGSSPQCPPSCDPTTSDRWVGAVAATGSRPTCVAAWLCSPGGNLGDARPAPRCGRPGRRRRQWKARPIAKNRVRLSCRHTGQKVATVWSQAVRWCNDEDRRRREARGHVDCDFRGAAPFHLNQTEVMQWLHPLTNAW